MDRTDFLVYYSDLIGSAVMSFSSNTGFAFMIIKNTLKISDNSFLLKNKNELNRTKVFNKCFFKESLPKLDSTNIFIFLASIRQMNGQVSRGSAGEYQADERAGVARLSWRVSGR